MNTDPPAKPRNVEFKAQEIHQSAAAVLALNELLLEKMERILPDYLPVKERADDYVEGLQQICWNAQARLRAALNA